MMSYKEAIARDARMIMLRELEKQVNGTLNVLSLRRALDAYGISRTDDWIETQLLALAEMDAVSVMHAGDIAIAKIEQAGRFHVSERAALVGVTRPSELG